MLVLFNQNVFFSKLKILFKIIITKWLWRLEKVFTLAVNFQKKVLLKRVLDESAHQRDIDFYLLIMSSTSTENSKMFLFILSNMCVYHALQTLLNNIANGEKYNCAISKMEKV